MPDNTSNKRIAKNSLFLTIRMVVVLLISLYTTRVVLKVLGVEDYGVYNVVCGFVAMFAFLNTSMSNGIQRFFNYELGKNGVEGANKVYITSLIIQLLLAIIIAILIESIGLWYLHNKMVIPENRMFAAECIFQFSVLGFLFIILQAPFTASVIAHEKMDFYAMVSILDAVLKLSIVIALPYISGDNLIWYGILVLMINVLNFLMYFGYSKRHFKEIKFKRFFDKGLFNSMLGFSGWNLFGSFSNIMEVQGINLVLNFFFGPIVNAARGVANQINGAVQSFVQNITMPVRPQVTQSYARGDIERTMSLTYGMSKLSSSIILMLGIPASIEINYLLHIWLGNNVPDHTASFTVLILCTSFVNSFNAPISFVVHATGKMRAYQLWGSIVRVSSVPIGFFLAKIYGISELCLFAVLFTATATHIVGLFITRKLIVFSLRDYIIKVVIPIIFVSVITLAIVFLIHILFKEGFMRLVLACIMSMFSIGISLFVIAFNKQERQIALQFLKPILSFFSN